MATATCEQGRSITEVVVRPTEDSREESTVWSCLWAASVGDPGERTPGVRWVFILH